MCRRQSLPVQWLIIPREGPVDAVRRLPRGSGVILLGPPAAGTMRRLRTLVRQRRLLLVIEGPKLAARVHNGVELRQALLRRTRFILLSPLFWTSSHPDWTPIRRMRAAALARLGARRLIALGGMNARRYATIAPLGFVGWAGISAWSSETVR